MSELLIDALFESQPELDALTVSDSTNRLFINDAVLNPPFAALADQLEMIRKDCVLTSVDFGFRPFSLDEHQDIENKNGSDVAAAIDRRIAVAQRELTSLLAEFDAQQEIIERLQVVDQLINSYDGNADRRAWAKQWFKVLRLEGQLQKAQEARKQTAQDQVLVGYAPRLWPLIESWRTATATIDGLKRATPSYLPIEPASSLNGLDPHDEAGVDVLAECEQEQLWTAVQEAHAAQISVQKLLSESRDPTASLDLVEAFVNEQQTQEVVMEITGGISTDRCRNLYPFVARSLIDARVSSIKLAVRTAQARRSELIAILIELDRAPLTETESDIDEVLQVLIRDIADARLRTQTQADDHAIGDLEQQLEYERQHLHELHREEWQLPPTLDEIDQDTIEHLRAEQADLQNKLRSPVRLGTIESQRQRIKELNNQVERGDVDGDVDGDVFAYARQVIFDAGEHVGLRLGRRHRAVVYQLPLILNEPFVAFDDATLYAVLDWLCGAPIDRQLILLTNDSRVHTWAQTRDLLRILDAPSDRTTTRELRVFSARTATSETMNVL